MTRTSAFTGLRCTQCHRDFSRKTTLSTCPNCNGLLDTVLDEKLLHEYPKTVLVAEPSMWRFKPFLPVEEDWRVVSADEGNTPLRQLKSQKGRVWVKDETRNPTGTFKDRGASLAITVLSGLGVRKLVLSSEGNAGCSFALYSNMARIPCHMFLPKLANPAKVLLSKGLGARVSRVDGTIGDAGKKAAAEAKRTGAYNSSTFVTPFRHDGKGTMALEICEALGWKSPDWVVYPVGGGVGLVGMWKMFKILEEIGWVSDKPRFVAVQPKGCAPVVRAYSSGREDVEEWKSSKTIALGLRIPQPLAGRWILKILRDSKSLARTVTDTEIVKTMRQLAQDEGLILEPSSAAGFAALPGLYDEGLVDRSEELVVIGTGSGLKTIENL